MGPLVAFDLAAVALDAGRCPRQGAPSRRGASIHIRPGVAGMVAPGEAPCVPQRPPDDFPCGRTWPQPLRALQAVVGKVRHHGSGRLCGRTHLADLPDRRVEFFIGIADDLACSLLDSSDRQPPAQSPMRRFFEMAAAPSAVQPGPCCCAQGPAESSAHPIMGWPWIIAPLCIDAQRVGPGPALQEALPVATGARAARRFSTQHGADSPQADCHHARRTTITPRGGGSRAALVLVDDDHEGLGPAQVTSPGGALVLARRARGVGADLPARGLAHVDQCGTSPGGMAPCGMGEWCEPLLPPGEPVRTGL